MRKRNILLFVLIIVLAMIWGAVYWYFIAPFADIG